MNSESLVALNFPSVATSLASPAGTGLPSSRRQWLREAIGCAVALGSLGSGVRRLVATEPTRVTAPAKFRVRSVLELQGEVRLKAQGAAVTRQNGKQVAARTAPVQSKSTLDYDEEYRLADEDRESQGVQYFHEANSEITVDRHTTKTTLRDTCREIVRLGTATGLVTAAPAAPLFAAERDLVEGSLTSMYLDQILTDREVSIADKWVVDESMVCRLLNLDAIQEGKLTVCLIDSDQEKAQLQLEGKLTALVRDVTTELTLSGKAVLERQSGYVSWLALDVEETREIGEAEPGFKIQAQLRVLRAPIEALSSGRTIDDVLADAPSLAAASLLQFQSDVGFYRFLADRRWSTYRDNGEEATLRFIVNNRLAAQCNITNLVDYETGRQLSLEGFQADMRRVIGASGGEILEASEKLSSTSHRLLRIVAGGSVEGVPIRWIHYHVSNDTGRRLSLSFTLDEASLDAFEEQDSQVVSSFELMAWPTKLDAATLDADTRETDAAEGVTEKSTATTPPAPSPVSAPQRKSASAKPSSKKSR
jgi:hypothetical protein